MPKTDQIGIFVHFGPGLAGSLGALLSIVARRLYLARHLFTLFLLKPIITFEDKLGRHSSLYTPVKPEIKANILNFLDL